jgi:ABC-type bacteriocin/lantibiotic exporter with double-glycine peptidase domain
MLLAYHGTETTEDELIRAANMEEGGLEIEELARLARNYGLQVDISELSLDDLADLVAHLRFPIVYLNRFPMDRQFAIHAVIPIRITRHFVTFLDPRRGQRRVFKRTFEACRRYLDYVGVF